MGRRRADDSTPRRATMPGAAERRSRALEWAGTPRRPAAGASRQRPRSHFPIRPRRAATRLPGRSYAATSTWSGRSAVGYGRGSLVLRAAALTGAEPSLCQRIGMGWNAPRDSHPARLQQRTEARATPEAGGVSRAEAAYGRPTAALCSTSVMSCCGIRWGMTRMSSRRSGRVRGRVRFWEKNW